MKRCIDDELNSFLQGKGLVNMGATGEVKSLHALKLGGQEGVNRLENHVPRKLWRIKTKDAQYDLCTGERITARAGGYHPRLGYKENNQLIHRLK